MNEPDQGKYHPLKIDLAQRGSSTHESSAAGCARVIGSAQLENARQVANRDTRLTAPPLDHLQRALASFNPRPFHILKS